MRIERREGGDERRILIAMLVDATVLGRIAARWPPQGGLFASQWANTVAGWAVGYHGRYGRAPGPHVRGLFEHWATKHAEVDKKVTETVERFLAGLSEEYEAEKEAINPQYIIDAAGRHFETVRLHALATGLEADLAAGDAEAAQQRIDDSHRLELGGGAGIDILSDTEAVRAAFETHATPLVTYPGALGELFGRRLCRGGFVAYEGPEKRGKTYWLLDLAWRAMLQRRRVAFFEVGDLSEADVIMRFAERATKRPQKPDTDPVRVPTAITWDGEGIAECTYKVRTFTDELDWRTAVKAFRRVAISQVRSEESYLRLSIHPADSVTVLDIRATVAQWAKAGWVADVIIIDYADILAAPPGLKDSRDQINKTWMQLRAMATEFHNLVATATQTDAQSYDAHTIGLRHFSNDKRKRAHVTASFGLNATADEKAAGITRVNCLIARQGKYRADISVHCGGSLAIANPVIVSTW